MTDADDEVLAGGVAHPGAVRRIGDEVERPSGTHTAAVHALFRHVRAGGGPIVPAPLAFDDAYEWLSFEPGDVPPPFPEWPSQRHLSRERRVSPARGSGAA